MKPSVWTRSLLLILFLSLPACQTSGISPTPAATDLASQAETPTLISTEIPLRATPGTQTETSAPELATGEIAYAHVEAISQGIGARVAGSAEELQTAQYIVAQFEKMA